MPVPSCAVSYRGAYVLLFLLALVWGGHWAVTKVGLRDLPPFTYGTLRVATGLAVLVGLLAARGRLRLPPRTDIPIVLSVGIGQVAATIALMNLALQVVPAGRSSVLVYTMPLWAAGIQATVLRRGLGARQAVGMALGLLGIAALLNPAAIDWQDPGQLTGSAALLASAVAWAATTIHIRRHRWTASPLDLQPWQLLVALVPLAALAVALEWGDPVHWSLGTLLVIAYSGPLATGFGYWASQSVSRVLDPIATTTGFLAVPVVGLLGGAIALGEPTGPLDVIGFAITIIGIAVVSLDPGSPG